MGCIIRFTGCRSGIDSHCCSKEHCLIVVLGLLKEDRAEETQMPLSLAELSSLILCASSS
ncbi:hypothetical protein [Wolbachia endosymbiont of Frankliniella intonsa]|uniref:hypothetical protein n=1 Tax=Wolbachia endosymbiont of Frankliniella intonsa TaxID=2902422 RepID=UPI00244ED0B4|nr:hypothetical protein [Wolbachia endosymbiont of Frankliniella intonsa]WGJ62132.1 hypothetical protein M3L71_08075 [Wolbachia endosymbiont of Frankliniella intonsa]